MRKWKGGFLRRVMPALPYKMSNRLNRVETWKRELSDQVLVLFHNIFARLKIISKISKTTPSYSDVPKFNSKVEHNNKEIIVDGSVSSIDTNEHLV